MTLKVKTSANFVTPASRKSGESTEAFLLTTQSNGRNKFGIANFFDAGNKEKTSGRIDNFPITLSISAGYMKSFVVLLCVKEGEKHE